MQPKQGKNNSAKRQDHSHKSSSSYSRFLHIEREFKVPVDQLFNAFKSANAIKTWWWPNGLHAEKVDFDFREGGRYFISMNGHDKGGGGMTGVFEEIVKNEKIVMTDSFANDEGRAISSTEAKMPGDWPEMVYITFDFESLGAQKTRLTLSQEGIPNDSQKECMKEWNEMFDKLETQLNQ